MEQIIVNILKSIENNGFESYIVGGYVRDYILGNQTSDIDIITNALPKDLLNIFPKGIVSKELYGSFRLTCDKYTFDITTYRKESKYEERRPTKVIYINNLIEDLKRRDFTINSLCMDLHGEVIDLLNGRIDLDNHLIRVIGKTKTKLKEDPLRILRAIRFAVTLDFKLDDHIIKFIKNNKNLLFNLSYDRKKDELNKIFASKNVIKGLSLLKKLDVLKQLEIDYNQVIYVNDLCGIWSQIEVKGNYNFTKLEKNNIDTIKRLISYGKITSSELYNYGLYYSLVAGSILGIDNQLINQEYHTLPIYKVSDIDVTCEDILKALNIKPSIVIKEILNDLESKIINHELENKKEDIINYIKRKW